MDDRGASSGNVSACELCHRRKVRCTVADGDLSCDYCKSVNQPCVPHLRKRKHGPILSPFPTKRTRSIVSAGTPLSVVSPSKTADVARSGHPALQTETQTSPGSYLGRTQYLNGTAPVDEEDARNYSSGRGSSLAEADQRYLHDLRAFDQPTRSLRDSLIAAFMEHCHPWMPIVDLQDLRSAEGFEPSLLLLNAVLVAGSRVSLSPEAQASGDMFYRRAKALFHLGFEKDPMTAVRSVCLLLWFNNSGPEHISMDASSFWLHMGVALAHQLGLHKETHHGRVDATLRRRLWWTLVIRDYQISTSHGRPRMINSEDSDVRPLAIEDFPSAGTDSALFIAYHDICSVLSSIAEALVRGTLGPSKHVLIQTRLLNWVKNLSEALRICHRITGELLPYDFKTRQLNLMFFTAVMLLCRPENRSIEPSAASILASSFSAGTFEDFYARGELGFLAPVFNFHLMTAAFAQVACYRYPALWPRAETELAILTKCLEVMAKRYPTAIGAQRVVKAALRAVQLHGQQQADTRPRLDGEQARYFSCFGPDLCSKWFLFFPEKEPRNLISHRYVSQSDRVLPPMAPTAQASPQAEFSSLDPSLAQPFHDSYESFFASNGAFTAVGNWMLGDWTAGLDWTADNYSI